MLGILHVVRDQENRQIIETWRVKAWSDYRLIVIPHHRYQGIVNFGLACWSVSTQVVLRVTSETNGQQIEQRNQHDRLSSINNKELSRYRRPDLSLILQRSPDSTIDLSKQNKP
jgi:hypothetical protein